MNIIFLRFIKDKRALVIISCAIVRMGYLGFHYYPLLDDYIQYGTYPTAAHPFNDVFLRIGLYSARPIAGLADIYIWGRFWSIMGVVLFIITLLHALSAYIFIVISEKLNAPLGMIFVSIYILCPVNIEGSYWISASSRIIVGLFFVSLSIYFLILQKSTPFFLYQFIAMFLYEQVAIFGFTLALIIIIYKKMWKSLYPLALNLIIFLSYYKAFSTMGHYAYRVALKIFNFGAVNDIASFWSITSIYTKGYIRGFGMNLLYFIPILIVSIFLASAEKSNKFNAKILSAGIILFAAPYAPFFVLSNNNAAFRTSLVPLIGLAIIIDNLFNLLKEAKKYAIFSLSFVFIVICVSELCDYKSNYEYDRRIVSYVAQKADRNKENAVIGAKRSNVEQNALFAEHIISVTSSDWALTGAVREYLGDRNFPMIQINPEKTDNINLISLNDF